MLYGAVLFFFFVFFVFHEESRAFMGGMVGYSAGASYTVQPRILDCTVAEGSAGVHNVSARVRSAGASVQCRSAQKCTITVRYGTTVQYPRGQVHSCETQSVRHPHTGTGPLVQCSAVSMSAGPTRAEPSAVSRRLGFSGKSSLAVTTFFGRSHTISYPLPRVFLP